MIKPTVRVKRAAEILEKEENTAVYMGSACVVSVREYGIYLDVVAYTDTADGLVMQTFRTYKAQRKTIESMLTKGVHSALVSLRDVNGRTYSDNAGILVSVGIDRIEPAEYCVVASGVGSGIEEGMPVTSRQYYKSRLAAESDLGAALIEKRRAKLWRVTGADESGWVLEETVPPQEMSADGTERRKVGA